MPRINCLDIISDDSDLIKKFDSILESQDEFTQRKRAIELAKKEIGSLSNKLDALKLRVKVKPQRGGTVDLNNQPEVKQEEVWVYDTDGNVYKGVVQLKTKSSMGIIAGGRHFTRVNKEVFQTEEEARSAAIEFLSGRDQESVEGTFDINLTPEQKRNIISEMKNRALVVSKWSPNTIAEGALSKTLHPAKYTENIFDKIGSDYGKRDPKMDRLSNSDRGMYDEIVQFISIAPEGKTGLVRTYADEIIEVGLYSLFPVPENTPMGIVIDGSVITKEGRTVKINETSKPKDQEKPKENKSSAEGKKIERKIRDEKLKKDIDNALDDLFGPSETLSSGGLDPQKIEKGVKVISLYLQAGINSLNDILEDLYAKYGDKLADIIDQVKGLYSLYKISAASDEQKKQMDSSEFIENINFETIKQKLDVSNRTTTSPGDSGIEPDSTPANETPLSNQRKYGRKNRGNDNPDVQRPQSGSNAGKVQPTLFGATGNNELPEYDEPISSKEDFTRDYDGRGNVKSGRKGSSNNGQTSQSNTPGIIKTGRDAELAEKKKLQDAAEDIPVIDTDINNISDTLPFLIPEQHETVRKAEMRFFNEEHQTQEKSFGKGFLITDGTGTGKTMTALGIIKRHIKRGAKKVLIITPSSAKTEDWKDEGERLNLNIHILQDTKDSGQDKLVSVTTFANFRTNKSIYENDYDLIIYDESHRILENKKGEQTTGAYSHYELSNRSTSDAFSRLTSIHPVWIESKNIFDSIREINTRINTNLDLTEYQLADLDNKKNKLEERYNQLEEEKKKLEPALLSRAESSYKKTKVVFLSATPFKTYQNLKYVNGYLFDWGNKNFTNSQDSRVDSESAFMLEHFGAYFEWKYHRLQVKSKSNPEAVSMQEVEFSEWMKREGFMSTRLLTSEFDYGREFPLPTLFDSVTFNKAYNAIFDYTTNKYDELRDAAREIFSDYNYSTQLYESLKANEAVVRAQEHLALGRKVIIFHRRKQSRAVPPFNGVVEFATLSAKSLILQSEEKLPDGQDVYSSDQKQEKREKAEKTINQINEFKREFSEVLNYEKSLNYSPAIDQIAKAFPSAVYINGDTPKKDKPIAIKQFNDTNSGVDVIVIQEESGKEGISLHDLTGERQRVLMSLSVPISTITALQVEGRPYRMGVKSNVIFEYLLLGLDSEIEYFGKNLNRRLATTENIAMGNLARDLIRSFSEGILFNSSAKKPNNEQGTGGKELDKRSEETVTGFGKSRLVYATRQKVTGRRDQREGVDFYPTPEPIGFKMIEWLDVRDEDDILEPSAGMGAIAMWVPINANVTAIEPSYSLYSKLTARAGGGNQKVLNQRFEEFSINNKFQGIAMNPPFGQGGAIAMQHIEKAFKHLREGGRIVAIVPVGTMDKKVDNFLYGTDDKGRQLNPTAALIASIKLPSVTFENAGTAISTRIIVIDKIAFDKIGQSKQPIIADLSFASNIDQLFDLIEDKRIPSRDVPEISEQAETGVGGESNVQKDGIFAPVIKTQRTDNGKDIWVARLNTRVDDFVSISRIAKKHGGFYSRHSNAQGFIFDSAEKARSFYNEVDPTNSSGSVQFMARVSAIEMARKKYDKAKKDYENKRKELYSSLKSDQPDLFGNTQTAQNSLFGNNESMKADASKIEGLLAPYKIAMNKALDNLQKAQDEPQQGTLFSATTSHKIKRINQGAWNKLISKIQKTFPGTKIITNKTEFYDLISNEDIDVEKYTILGARLSNGDVYIDTEHLNADTPIHEFSHVWEALFPTKWAQGVKMVKASQRGVDVFKMLREDGGYDNLSDKKLWSEVLNTIIGEYGAGQFNQGVLRSIYEWVKNIINEIGIKFGIVGLTPETKLNEFVKMVTGQILSGKPFNQLDNIIYSPEIKTMIINGKQVSVKEIPEGLDVINGFYSPLEKSIIETKQEKMPAKQWLDKFARGEEAKWTGLQDWLSQQQDSVSKQDILNHLKDNRISVVEVVKGENNMDWRERNGVLRRDYDKVELEITKDDEGYYKVWDGERKIDEEIQYLQDAKEIADRYAENQYGVNVKENSDTKFSEYQLEGEKENYKEVLVTLPNKELAKKPKWNEKQVSLNLSSRGDYSETQKRWTASIDGDEATITELPQKGKYVLDFRGVMNAQFDSFNEAEKYITDKQSQDRVKGKSDFKSSHFDEPNILVHLRMNTRTDAQGNKVLFLEEVQSDWGQKGKKEGFENKQFSVTYQSSEGIKEQSFPTREKAQEFVDKIGRSNVSSAGIREINNGSVVTAPFVTDTNAWTKLGLKVALKEAVKQGADKIAWTTGEQQNERYDLSKQVQSISYEKKSKEFSSKAQEKGQDLYSLYIETKESGYEQFDDLTISEVEGYVGKDIANKIQSNEGSKENLDTSKGNKKVNKLTGIDLKVGGKGMKRFYGSPKEGSLGIVGQVAKSLFKQEPKTVKIKISDNLNAPFDITVKDESGRITPHIFDSKSKALAWLSNEESNGRKYEIISEKSQEEITTIQHSIDITPELKAQVPKGLPQFMIYGTKGAKNIDNAREGSKILNNLNNAKRMLRSGKDMATIKRATGWEIGLDQKWKLELTDSKRITTSNMEINDYGDYDGTLEQIYLDTTLFEAYPQLKKTYVKIYEGNELEGQWTSDKSIIIHAPKNTSELDLIKTIAHEIQHAIQEIEGFPIGGNPNNLIPGEIKYGLIKATSEQIQNIKNSNLPESNRQEIIDNLESRIKNILDMSVESIKDLGYKLLAGEVEARNVEERILFENDRIRETLLIETEDVGREYQTIIYEKAGIPRSKQLDLFDYESQKDEYITKETNKTPANDQLEYIKKGAIAVWNEFKNIQLTGEAKVRNADDVAFIAKALENKSVEHAFAVYVDKRGNTNIQLLSIGGRHGTVIDPISVLNGVIKYKAKKVYLIHNHPSGSLNPSREDQLITKKINELITTYERNIELEHIIINTLKREYTLLDSEGEIAKIESPRPESTTNETILPVYISDEKTNIELDRAPAILNSSSRVFDAIQHLRFGEKKNGMIILDRRNTISSLILKKDEFSDKEVLKLFSEDASSNGIIFFTNKDNQQFYISKAKYLKSKGVQVYDVIVFTEKQQYPGIEFISGADEGMLNEVNEKYTKSKKELREAWNKLGRIGISFDPTRDQQDMIEFMKALAVYLFEFSKDRARVLSAAIEYTKERLGMDKSLKLKQTIVDSIDNFIDSFSKRFESVTFGQIESIEDSLNSGQSKAEYFALIHKLVALGKITEENGREIIEAYKSIESMRVIMPEAPVLKPSNPTPNQNPAPNALPQITEEEQNGIDAFIRQAKQLRPVPKGDGFDIIQESKITDEGRGFETIGGLREAYDLEESSKLIMQTLVSGRKKLGQSLFQNAIEQILANKDIPLYVRNGILTRLKESVIQGLPLLPYFEVQKLNEKYYLGEDGQATDTAWALNILRIPGSRILGLTDGEILNTIIGEKGVLVKLAESQMRSILETGKIDTITQSQIEALKTEAQRLESELIEARKKIRQQHTPPNQSKKQFVNDLIHNLRDEIEQLKKVKC